MVAREANNAPRSELRHVLQPVGHGHTAVLGSEHKEHGRLAREQERSARRSLVVNERSSHSGNHVKGLTACPLTLTLCRCATGETANKRARSSGLGTARARLLPSSGPKASTQHLNTSGRDVHVWGRRSRGKQRIQEDGGRETYENPAAAAAPTTAAAPSRGALSPIGNVRDAHHEAEVTH